MRRPATRCALRDDSLRYVQVSPHKERFAVARGDCAPYVSDTDAAATQSPASQLFRSRRDESCRRERTGARAFWSLA